MLSLNFLTYVMKKIIIIPDVHGRSFWKEAVNNLSEDEKVIFLGDYVDPYGWEGINREDAINILKEVIEFKKAHEDNVVLLCGNHDFQYIDLDCSVFSRYDSQRAAEIRKIFTENLDLFNLAYIEENYLFSHSGILKPWVEDSKSILGENPGIEEIPGILNRAFHKNPAELDRILYIVGRERGGWSDCGSLIWGDVHEFTAKVDERQYPGIYQIFGHTQLRDKAIITDRWACLDCRKAFKLEENTIKEL